MRFQQVDIPPVALPVTLKKVSFFCSLSLTLSLTPAHSVISARLFWFLKIFPKGWRAAFIYLSPLLFEKGHSGAGIKESKCAWPRENGPFFLFWERESHLSPQRKNAASLSINLIAIVVFKLKKATSVSSYSSKKNGSRWFCTFLRSEHTIWFKKKKKGQTDLLLGKFRAAANTVPVLRIVSALTP